MQFVWCMKYFGRGSGVSVNLLHPCGVQPAPNDPILSKVLDGVWSLRGQFGVQRYPVYELPVNVTRNMIGQKIVARMNLRNFLDPYTFNITFNRPNIFRVPRGPELRQNGQAPPQVRIGNLLDAHFTQLPDLTLNNEPPERQLVMLNELCCGPYQVDLMPDYIQSLQNLAVENIPAPTIQAFNALRRGVIRHHTCWYFDQLNPPVNWPNNIPFQPIRILCTKIPSRFLSNAGGNNMHTVCIAFVPQCVIPQPSEMSWNMINRDPNDPHSFTYSPPLKRLQMWICGDRARNRCKVGARTVIPCAHELSAIALGCVFAYNPALQTPHHRDLNVIDPSKPRHLNAELATNRHQ